MDLIVKGPSREKHDHSDNRYHDLWKYHEIQKDTDNTGCVVIETAFGDVHPTGKRIMTGCPIARMIEVKDLGINARS